MELLKSTIRYGTAGFTSLLCLTGAIVTRDNNYVKSIFLIGGSIQGVLVLVSANENEQAEMAHNDVRDVQAQARVNKLTQSLVYGEETYGEQLWLTLKAMREGGYREDEVLGLLSRDVSVAKATLAKLESKYGVL